jgi:hypothetical protein
MRVKTIGFKVVAEQSAAWILFILYLLFYTIAYPICWIMAVILWLPTLGQSMRIRCYITDKLVLPLEYLVKILKV